MRPEIRPKNRAAWRIWLADNHGSGPGVWLIWRKKGSTTSDLSLEAAVEEALCFGWIDSRLRPIDREWAALMFTPRRPRSIWSQSNKRRVASLIKRGLMTEAGLRAVAVAKRNGSWSALDGVQALQVPDDLAGALAKKPAARRNFDTSSASAKRSALWWIQSAKRPQTRERRIQETVRRLNYPGEISGSLQR